MTVPFLTQVPSGTSCFVRYPVPGQLGKPEIISDVLVGEVAEADDILVTLDGQLFFKAREKLLFLVEEGLLC